MEEELDEKELFEVFKIIADPGRRSIHQQEVAWTG